MQISIGCDHAALEAKTEVITYLKAQGHAITDVGTHDDQSCDFPDYAAAVSRHIQGGSSDRGILICGTGIGMSMAANRFTGVRAALCYTEQLAELSRLHNDANVLCLGARTQSIESMIMIISKWLNTSWEGGRHGQRLQKIEKNARGQDVA